MGARTLEQISTAGQPAWAVGVEVESFVRFIATEGPYKTETLLFQVAAGDVLTADDTFKSRLAHPLWVTVQSTTNVNNNTDGKLSAEVNSLESDSNFKTITLRNAEGTNGFGIMITVYGF